MNHNHWFSIAQLDSHPLAQHMTTCLTATGSEQQNMIHNH
ncbi:hypothetical protein CRYPD_177 [uncultured Candidatus Thioglobus sp.]|nr:hypothetical protein CRYPD_177 [uncultured Candidatus Thioglobus sp.]